MNVNSKAAYMAAFVYIPVFFIKVLYNITMKKIVMLSSFFLMVPFVGFAQLGPVDTFFNNINEFIGNVLIPLVFGLTLLIFIWGMFRFFIWGGGNDEERSKGKQLILWSIVGLVMMTSIWGIVNMFSGGIFPDQGPPKMPTGLTRP